jgi:hypothetical protein
MVVMNLFPPKAAAKHELLFSINLDSTWMRGLPKNFSYWLCFTHIALPLKVGSYLEMVVMNLVPPKAAAKRGFLF